MDFRVIQTADQYRTYLDDVQRLVAQAPNPGSADADRLELLCVLIEAYEAQKFPVEPPDPVDAILFRMKEAGLKQADLIPYFGTRSRVSEILNRKRPLTVPMIRALSIGLGISADTLVGAATKAVTTQVDWSLFPSKELVARGWLSQKANAATSSVSDLVKAFIVESLPEYGTPAYKRTLNGEAYSPSTKLSLLAWMSAVIHKARAQRPRLAQFSPGFITADFLRELAQLSWFDHGPLLAVEYLQKHGIAVVIEPHLKGTLLDGAALKDKDGTPIIGLTLRHDRLDSFWFTLMHEVVHIWKHVDSDQTFVDDLDIASEDRREAEANRLAREAFIPRVLWKRSAAHLEASRDGIDQLSRSLKIHPAIVAGRVRRETGNYQLFSEMVGHGAVRQIFSGADGAAP